MAEALTARRELLTRDVLPNLADPVLEAPRFDATLADLIAAVRAPKVWLQSASTAFMSPRALGGMAQDADQPLA